MEQNKPTDLGRIKRHYGEEMMRLCRTLFPTILENEGVLFKVIDSSFARSKFLYDDILSNNKIAEEKKEDIIPNKINGIDFSYIPIKICLIGHSYSGRSTQAKLLCEKYKNLKSYSVNDISQFYLDEYKRLHETNEKNHTGRIVGAALLRWCNLCQRRQRHKRH
jgi:hypothetical protein